MRPFLGQDASPLLECLRWWPAAAPATPRPRARRPATGTTGCRSTTAPTAVAEKVSQAASAFGYHIRINLPQESATSSAVMASKLSQPMGTGTSLQVRVPLCSYCKVTVAQPLSEFRRLRMYAELEVPMISMCLSVAARGGSPDCRIL
ncbi:unnamed protein product [Prorocentrum cordatum]|uniref:Uncharacterized protein n=1 Tax=Prorocentrum cordatum TaxID=2364126 RepID=A0ABN9SYD5_9DINO|nr:unnamed protein product [Polarella glacialis]